MYTDAELENHGKKMQRLIFDFSYIFRMKRAFDLLFSSFESIIMWSMRLNNYLLTGNKVALFSPRQTRDILLPER